MASYRGHCEWFKQPNLSLQMRHETIYSNQLYILQGENRQLVVCNVCYMQLWACQITQHSTQIAVWHIQVHGKWHGRALILQVTCARKGFGHTRLDSLCTYTAEDFEFLDTPVHIHVHVVTIHKYKTIMTVLIASVLQIMVLPM